MTGNKESQGQRPPPPPPPKQTQSCLDPQGSGGLGLQEEQLPAGPVRAS